MNSHLTVCLVCVKKRHKGKFVPRLLPMIVADSKKRFCIRREFFVLFTLNRQTTLLELQVFFQNIFILFQKYTLKQLPQVAYYSASRGRQGTLEHKVIQYRRRLKKERKRKIEDRTRVLKYTKRTTQQIVHFIFSLQWPVSGIINSATFQQLGSMVNDSVTGLTLSSYDLQKC